MGTLDGRTYSEGDQTIEVMAILLSNGFVAFNVRPHPSVDFVLTVDGTEFASADASEVKSRTLISYVWATTLDWAEDDRVALSLTLKGTDSAEQSEPAENTPATGLPTITGTPQVDGTLTASTSAINDEDGLTKVAFEYQWIAGGTDIAGATGSSYTLTSSELGKTIQVRVTFTDDANHEETLTSEATDAVAATKPGVPGHLHVFPHDTEALDVNWHAPASDGGSAITGYKVQWKEAADSWETESDVSEATVTGTTHTITGLTEDVEYAVRVVAVNDVGEGQPSYEATGTPIETVPPLLDTATVNGRDPDSGLQRGPGRDLHTSGGRLPRECGRRRAWGPRRVGSGQCGDPDPGLGGRLRGHRDGQLHPTHRPVVASRPRRCGERGNRVRRDAGDQ